jgi:aminoglycoside 6-adenylyltransferase
VLFAGGLDVDLAFIDPAAGDAADPGLADVVGLVFGRGARVLLDRDGEVTTMLAALSPAEAAPRRTLPDAAGFNQLTADFWYHAVWTAKHLRRGELWWAKGSCDGHMKGLLLSVLEWDATPGSAGDTSRSGRTRQRSPGFGGRSPGTTSRISGLRLP